MLISYSATKLAIIVGKSTILHQKKIFLLCRRHDSDGKDIINFCPFTVA